VSAHDAEIRLVREAQNAAAAGRFEAALGSLAEHARRFPTGRLIEEREALRIQSLSKLGRTAEARRAAKAFRARFPRSVLIPRLGELGSATE
jgi:outer membrane protein assembly factor BamD (BamD/ComL family)